MGTMKKSRSYFRLWPGVMQWFVGAGKLLLVFAVGLLVLAYVVPALAVVAVGFLALIALVIGAVLVYGMFQVRKLRRQMREFSKTFSERSAGPGGPFDDSPPRPRQRVQCKVRDTQPRETDGNGEQSDK